MKKYIMEFVGTMFLILSIIWTSNPVAIGVMLMAIVYMGAHISGAHYNPAVTLAFWLRGKLKSNEVGYYMLAQALGGFVAAMVYWFLLDQAYPVIPAAGVPLYKIFFVETLFTAFFAFSILTVVTAKKTKVNHLFGLVIGLSLMAVVFMGGICNPAVSFGTSLFDFMMRGTAIRFMPTYVAGSLLGGAVAALFYRFIYCEEFR